MPAPERQFRVVSDEEGPRFHCLECHDEPAAWRLYWCPGVGEFKAHSRAKVAAAIVTSVCARRKDHGQHTYAERCGCSATNPVIAEHRRRIESFRVKREQKERTSR